MNYTIPEEGQRQVIVIDQLVSQKLRNSMLWMVLGLLTTMGTMFALLANPSWLRLAYNHFTMILFIELGVVFLFSSMAMRVSAMALKGMFIAYSILNGLTLIIVALAYGPTAVMYAFLGTLAFFISFAVIGAVTKKDLTSLTPYLLAAVVAMIIVSLVSMFFNLGSTVHLVLGYLGVAVFAVFTAVDVNRIKKNIVMAAYEDESVLDRIEILGALNLYLDFINIFLSLLRIFGRR